MSDDTGVITPAWANLAPGRLAAERMPGMFDNLDWGKPSTSLALAAMTRSDQAKREFISHAVHTERAAATVAKLLRNLRSNSAYLTVMEEFAQAARNGEGVDVGLLADAFADNDNAVQIAHALADLFEAAMSAHKRGPTLLLARLIARALQLLDAAEPPPPAEPLAPLDGIHRLAAPAPANAPPHGDLPTLREVAA